MPMTLSEVRKLLKSQPFAPFQIHLADGRSFPIEQPDYLFVPPEGRIVFPWDKAGKACDVIDLLLVTFLELKPGKAS